MSKVFISKDVISNSLEFIDRAVADWTMNARSEIHEFPDADIVIVHKDSHIYLMSTRERFRKKIAFVPLTIGTETPAIEGHGDADAIFLKKGDPEVDFINSILAATTNSASEQKQGSGHDEIQ